jgi:hypothetical protein
VPALSSKLISFFVPSDEAFLAALGRVTVTHSHMDYALRMMVKSLTDVGIEEALDATEGMPAKALRERIGKLARKRLVDGAALVRLQALVQRAGRLTERRNEFSHSLIAKGLDEEEPHMRGRGRTLKPLPEKEELDELAVSLWEMTRELNEQRLHGFIAEALQKQKAQN